MHCNLKPPEPRQSFPALTTTPCQVWSRWTYLLPYDSVFAADTLFYAVTTTFDPVTLTFDLWPWTFAVYRLWRDETLYQISTQSSYPRRSYCDFNIRTTDLKHVLHVAFGCGIMFTKFDFRQLIRAWILAFLCNTLCYTVTLTFDPLTLKVRVTSGVTWWKSVRNLSEIEQSPAELLIIYRPILRIFAHVYTMSLNNTTLVNTVYDWQRTTVK